MTEAIDLHHRMKCWEDAYGTAKVIGDKAQEETPYCG